MGGWQENRRVRMVDKRDCSHLRVPDKYVVPRPRKISASALG